MSLRFIVPASPRRRERPPVGDRLLHEVKFDGYRIQAHMTLQHPLTQRIASRPSTATATPRGMGEPWREAQAAHQGKS